MRVKVEIEVGDGSEVEATNINYDKEPDWTKLLTLLKALWQAEQLIRETVAEQGELE